MRVAESGEHEQLGRAMGGLEARIVTANLDSTQLEDLAEAARKLHLAMQYERLVLQTLTAAKVSVGQRLVERAGEMLHNLHLSCRADGAATEESLQREVEFTSALLRQVQRQMERLQLLAAMGPPGRTLCRQQRELLYRSSTSELLLDHWMSKAIFYSLAVQKDQQAGAALGDLWREVRVAYQAHRVVLAAIAERIAHFDVYTMHFVWNRVTKPLDRLAGWGPPEQILQLPGGEDLQALLVEFVHDFLGPLRPLLGTLLGKTDIGSGPSPIQPLFPDVFLPQALVKDEGWGEWNLAEGLFGRQGPDAAKVRRQILGYKAGLVHWKQQRRREEDPRALHWNAVLEYERLVEARLEECLGRAGEQQQGGLSLTWQLSYQALYTGVLADLHRSILDGRSRIVVPAPRQDAHLAAWEDDGGGTAIKVELSEFS